MKTSKWDARIERARMLERQYPFAAEGLLFYAHIANFQRSLYSEIEKTGFSSNSSLQGELDLTFLLPRFSEFLSLIRQIAPESLSKTARELQEKGVEGWKQTLADFWHGAAVSPAATGSTGDESAGTPERSLPWIFLQPYAEFLAERSKPVISDGTPSSCPLCGCKPIAGVLRSEGDGAKKSLICMLCAHEWAFRRLYCPSCGEEREPQMAFYSAPEIAHVRVDVCDTCHTYLKTIDLTKTGLADPVVDELATVPLDLWAREHGYEKLQINLLGI